MCALAINISKIPYPEVKNSKLVGNFHQYVIGKNTITTNHRGLRTENIDSCTAGVLQAGSRHFMFHAAPELQPVKTVKIELARQIELLRESCDNIKAFICGGWALDNKDIGTVKSFDLYSAISEALDALDIKFTMVCGKEKGKGLDNIFSVGESVTMWNPNLNGLPSRKNMSQEEVLDLLSREYQFVESNSEQRVRFIDEFAPKTQRILNDKRR